MRRWPLVMVALLAGLVLLILVWQSDERTKALAARDQARQARAAAGKADAPKDAADFWKAAESAMAEADARCHPFGYPGAAERYACAEQAFGSALLVAGVNGGCKDVRFLAEGIAFAPIRAGTYRMGHGPADPVMDEGKPRLLWYERRKGVPEAAFEVSLTRPCWMAVHEVTRARFAAFVEAARYLTSAEQRGWMYRFAPSHDAWNIDDGEGLSWKNPGFAQADDHPVVGISWEDANAYCAWFSAKTRRAIRLPTEAEWEYACRAGTSTRFAPGDTVESLRKAAWLSVEPWDWESQGYPHPCRYGRAATTRPVGSLQPNAWGLYDMHGNASEWCRDTFAYYPRTPQADYVGGEPQELITHPGPAGPIPLRVIRGGGWAQTPDESSSAARAGAEAGYSFDYSGFRLVLEVPLRPEP